MIAVVNYGIGNLDSVVRALRNCDAEATITSDPEQVERADGIVLPGVGFFSKAMDHLRESGLLDVLNHRVLDARTPVLGICLGFQMFSRFSEEGDVDGLGWIDAETKRFRFDGMDPMPKVPHLGWNDLDHVRESPLFEGIHRDACFYFAHSYYVSCNDESAVLTRTEYGHDFVSSVQHDNIFGTQFHPEKSHANGVQVIGNFVRCTRHA